jgi:hypothetical protein
LDVFWFGAWNLTPNISRTNTRTYCVGVEQSLSGYIHWTNTACTTYGSTNWLQTIYV